MLTQETDSSRESSPRDGADSFLADSETRKFTNNDQIISSGEACVRQYELRPGPRNDSENVWAAWQDHDESGNYDPSAKLQKLPIQKKRRDQDENGASLEDPGERPAKKMKIVSPLVARREGRSFVVTLAFKSAQAMTKLQQYQGQDNWPEESYNKLALPDPDRSDLNDQPGLWQEPGSRRLRSRYNDDSSFLPFQESKSIEEDLVGHPAARGCVACYKLGENCSLLKTPMEYPCVLCKGECECELIKPPKRKRACEECKRKRIKCSYQARPDDEDEHSLPCLECSDACYHCIAGPRIDYPNAPPTRLDIEYDWDAYRRMDTKKLGKGRPFVACTVCRSNKKRCSLRPSDEPPCKACKEAGFDCTFDALEPSRQNATPQAPATAPQTIPMLKKSSTESSKKDSVLADCFRPDINIPNWQQIPDDTPISVSSDSDSGRPATDAANDDDDYLTIRTAFRHPITFDHSEGGYCDFCQSTQSTRRCLFGFPIRTVRVVERGPGYYYERDDDSSPSHPARRAESTRMCPSCTNARVQICACRKHQLQPLQLRDAEMDERLDQKAAYDRMMDGSADKVDYRWCSICPSLAVSECVASQKTAKLGCGLLLCRTCAWAVDAKRGDLQAMLADGPEAKIADIEKETDDDSDETDEEGGENGGQWLMGWRADAEFLKYDGPLMRAKG
ncbi:MAG: hypothetical protein M1821_003726 [Bathelium mastoideum]|nr:MAG: hypothetical protein M1821_003726 [Bathelium mastoideum]